ncbi:MAG: response regulator transcription factor [Staphylococcus simulans]|uniref:response regulator transcription factor n=1 Tax=Staphylococcus TaxID=1279 RepID=UPI0008A9F019|nr:MULTISPECIES: response regulator transcription factor [Staphylococcus]MDK7926403.1 response regulator transcription factor [Staphylococcus simulans]MDK8314993.1 response regulator transcription factor [Staphylococcus simulans]OHR50469.1 DNA-binding response regulator [Staphylococcus sp. HMSC056D08]OHS45770.1 DNA-binding response regulator [Staphylococcus sp. HMSC65H10]PTI94686.1 DNA-binding response regulator [Staphylococcus simulans]
MINVVLAEDQEMLRKAMVQLIEMDENINIIADTSSGAEAWQMIESNQPDIAILDIEMPELTGLEVLNKIRETKLNTKVIIVTTFKRPGYFERAVANDVDAYVLKERSVEELIQTMHNIMAGQKEYSETLMTTYFNEKNPLTPSEQLILKEIGNGYSSKEIAQKLFLSNGTVRNYTSVIIDKMETENRFDAWKKAIEKGWII